MADRKKMFRNIEQAAGRGRTTYRAPGKGGVAFRARAPEGPGGGRVAITKTTRTSDMKPFKGGATTQIKKRKKK